MKASLETRIARQDETSRRNIERFSFSRNELDLAARKCADLVLAGRQVAVIDTENGREIASPKPMQEQPMPEVA